MSGDALLSSQGSEVDESGAPQTTTNDKEENDTGLAVTSSSSSSSLSSLHSSSMPSSSDMKQNTAVEAEPVKKHTAAAPAGASDENAYAKAPPAVPGASCAVTTSTTPPASTHNVISSHLHKPQNAESPALSENNACSEPMVSPSPLMSLISVIQPQSQPPINLTFPAAPKSPPFSSSSALSQVTKGTACPEKNNKKRLQVHNTQHSQPPLRRGKWTAEEEEYVTRVISDFNSGYLRAPAGTTLRTYLAEKLHCDPMRITKKFTGDACIGKRVFHPAVRCAANAEEIDKAQAELDGLEKRWRKRLAAQKKDSSRKSNRNSNNGKKSLNSSPNIIVANPAQSDPAATRDINQSDPSVVTRTANWLDRASSVLANQKGNRNVSDVECQMKAVKQLIHETPIIKHTSAGIPSLLEHTEITNAGEGRCSTPSVAATFPAAGGNKQGGNPEAPACNFPSFASQNSKPAQKVAESAFPTKRKISASGGVSDRGSDDPVPQRSTEDQRIVGACKPQESASSNPSSQAVGVSAASGADVEALVGFLNCVRKESMGHELPCDRGT